MKRMIVMAVALLPIASFAQVKDTLVVENATSVQVISSPSSLSVKIDGTVEKPDFRYSASMAAAEGESVRSESLENADRMNLEFPFMKKRNLSHWKFTFFNSEEVGLFEGILGGEDLFGGAETRQISADLGIIGIRYYPGLRNHFVSLGWHVGYSSTQRVKGSQRFSMKDGNIVLTDYPAGVSNIGETTDIWRLRYSVPLQYTFVFGKTLSWRASAGIETHFNIWNYTRSHYTLNGTHVVETIDNIKPNLVSMDLMTSFSYRGFGLRFRYSPLPAFTAPNGPAFRTWSIGLLVEY